MSNTVEADLIALENKRGAALMQRDEATLDALFSDDLVHIHSTGNQMGKREIIDYAMKVLHYLVVKRSNLKVRVYGDVAVMTGNMSNTMKRIDKPDEVKAEALVTQVWVRGGPLGWRMVSFHSVRAPAA